MPAALALEQVSKRYTRSGPWALQEVTLEVPQGAVLVLLGPNGAGKTTLLKLALGVLFPTGGRVSVLGTEDLETARKGIAYVPQRDDLHLDFTAREYLRWLGLIGGETRATVESQVTHLLDRLSLAEQADNRLSTYSRGMLQRVGLAQALLSDPDLLLLDEPGASLDPDGQEELEALIRELRAQGKTCVIVSQHLDEAARLATHIGILKKGALADFREWSTAALVHTFSLAVPPLSPEVQHALLELPQRHRGTETFPGPDISLGLRDALASASAVPVAEWNVSYHPEQEELLVTSPADHVPPDLLHTLLAYGVPVRGITPQGPSLPEVYHAALREHEGPETVPVLT